MPTVANSRPMLEEQAASLITDEDFLLEQQQTLKFALWGLNVVCPTAKVGTNTKMPLMPLLQAPQIYHFMFFQ